MAPAATGRAARCKRLAAQSVSGRLHHCGCRQAGRRSGKEIGTSEVERISTARQTDPPQASQRQARPIREKPDSARNAPGDLGNSHQFTDAATRQRPADKNAVGRAPGCADRMALAVGFARPGGLGGFAPWPQCDTNAPVNPLGAGIRCDAASERSRATRQSRTAILRRNAEAMHIPKRAQMAHHASVAQRAARRARQSALSPDGIEHRVPVCAKRLGISNRCRDALEGAVALREGGLVKSPNGEMSRPGRAHDNHDVTAQRTGDQRIREGNATPAWLANDSMPTVGIERSVSLAPLSLAKPSASTSMSSRTGRDSPFYRIRTQGKKARGPRPAPVIPFYQAKRRRGPLRSPQPRKADRAGQRLQGRSLHPWPS